MVGLGCLTACVQFGILFARRDNDSCDGPVQCAIFRACSRTYLLGGSNFLQKSVGSVNSDEASS